jgi:alpha-L-fucosidase
MTLTAWLLAAGCVAAGTWAISAEPDRETDPLVLRKLEWFQDQRFGLMVHWGAYSQWGCIESWPLIEEDKWARPDDLKAWTERGKDMQKFMHDYWLLPRTFNPTKFDPGKWAAAAKYAGMKYLVFTTKHHDGFCMYDTKLTDYRITAPDVPFHTDPRANVAKVVFDTFRKEGFGIGLYYSKADWHCPYYWDPAAPARTRNPNYDTLKDPGRWRKFVEFVHGQIEEITSTLGAAEILWLDAGQVRPPQQDIQMDKVAAIARKNQPGMIVVDRTVGGKYENYRTPEQEIPDKPLPYIWESCLTMGDQWSYKPDDKYKSTQKLIGMLVDIVAKGGNFLLNVGPQPDGELPPTALSRLKEIGDWMAVNAEAIHGSRAIAPYKDGQVAFTRRGDAVYAIYLAKDDNDPLPPAVSFSGIRPAQGSSISMLGVKEPVKWRTDESGKTTIDVPAAVRQSPPCRHAWVFRIRG